MKKIICLVVLSLMGISACDSDDGSVEEMSDGADASIMGDGEGGAAGVGGTGGSSGNGGTAGSGASGGAGSAGDAGAAGAGGFAGVAGTAGTAGEAGTGGGAGIGGEAGMAGAGGLAGMAGIAGEAGMGGEGGGAGMFMNCEQPDGASCQAAGCIWTYPGCVSPDEAHPCYRFNQVVCAGRAECMWLNDHCAPDPRQQSCGDLRQRECIGQVGRCVWENEACMERPDGPCEQLEEVACTLRPDCEAMYSDGVCDEGEARDAPENGARRRPPPPEPCEPEFTECRTRMLECGDVPIEVCERTPGCVIVEMDAPCPPDGECEPLQICARDDDPRCDERERDECEGDARCRLEITEECGPGGRPDRPQRDPDGGGEREFDPNRIIVAPCDEEWACVPNENPPCDRISLDECRERMDCEVVQEEVCDCDPQNAPQEDGGNRRPDEGNERALPPVPARRIQPPPDECPCVLEDMCQSVDPR